jgi:hypothetical protein
MTLTLCTLQTHVSLWLRLQTAPKRDRQMITSLPCGERLRIGVILDNAS